MRVTVSQTGVCFICLRHELANFKKRLKALKAIVVEDGIIMTEAQMQALEKTRNWCGAARQGKARQGKDEQDW